MIYSKEPMMNQPPETLEDLIDRVLKDTDLADTSRRNLASSIRRIAKLQNVSLRIRADFVTLRRLLAGKAMPPTVSKGRWANIRSEVTFALTRYNAPRRAPLKKDLSPNWLEARESLTEPKLVLGLSRLIHWCSRDHIPPEDVDNTVMARFHDHLREGTLIVKPNHIFRQTCKMWNDACNSVSGWPGSLVTLPSFRNLVSLPLDRFPASFAADIGAFERWAGGTDLSADDLRKPLRATTIAHRPLQYRRFASAMVGVGRPIEEFSGLAVLLDRTWFGRTMQAELERLQKDWCRDNPEQPEPPPSFSSLQEMAGALLALGRHYVKMSPEQLSHVEKVRKRLKTRPRGFTAKNRERIRQFADPRTQHRFLTLGDRLLEMAKKKNGQSPEKAALLVQTALIHEILMVAPMRFRNLTLLHLDRHFRSDGPDWKGRIVIIIAGDEVKNDEPLEFELPAPTASLLRSYISEHRPGLLPGVDDGWLFPGKVDGHLHQVTLAMRLVGAARRHGGFTINPHLYRHLAAYFYLPDHPGDYETIRRLLGHKSLETTLMFYADFERLTASRRFAENVLERCLKATTGKSSPAAKAP